MTAWGSPLTPDVFLMYFFEHMGLEFLYMKQNKTVNGIFALELNSILDNK